MVCPHCKQASTQVLDSRDTAESIRRRRECLSCKYRFTTYERVETPTVRVQKKNGDVQRFDSEKIRTGIALSCKNRPVSSAQIDAAVRQVEQAIIFSGKEEVTSDEIGIRVQTLLQSLDQIAYVRFASVYQSFTDLQQFEQEIQNIH